ncbi:MAG TPA: antitoxin family protein [Thermoanaerobaculia bacterium]|nr:antitoxin family protein [Thermoanaerobaculia bacterium]
MAMMTKSVNAIYEDGVLRLEEPVELEKRSRVRVRIEIPDTPQEGSSRGEVERRRLHLAPGKRALFDRIRALREKAPPVEFDIVETLRKFREHG